MPQDLTYLLLKQSIQRNESSENINSYFQLGKTSVSAALPALQSTYWWAGALAINITLGTLPSAVIGLASGYAYSYWRASCIEENRSMAVRKYALRSPNLGHGALYGAASVGLIGTAITLMGLFKNPSIENAKHVINVTGVGVGIYGVMMKSAGG